MGILIDRGTTILVQGITGREASFFTRESLDYGARVVAGVTPGKGGQEVYGVPVYDCVRNALRNHRIDAGVVSVPPFAVRDAALESIESGIRLLVVMTERVPRRDVAALLDAAGEHGARIIGPNSLGLISPGESKLGAVGGNVENTLRTFTKGPVGVMSRSGGMTSEFANILGQEGLGQSTCVSIGGDPLIGSTFQDLFPLFEEDRQTRAVALFCEPGGIMEEEFARFYSSLSNPKPVVAFIAGRFADRMPGTRFGHAAVIVEGDRGSTRKKRALLKDAGVQVADRLSDVPKFIKELLKDGHVH